LLKTTPSIEAKFGLFGSIIISCKSVQRVKTALFRVVIEDGMLMLLSDVQPAKVELPRLLILFGRETSVRDVQLIKALLPIVLTPF